MTTVMIPPHNGWAAPEEAEVSGHGQPRPAGRTDRGLTVMAVAGVTALTGLGWVLSYTALRQLALSADMPVWAATLWPLCIDLFVFVATLAAISDRRRGRPTTYAWTLAGLYSAATVAGNVTAAGPDHLAQAVHAMPAVTMVLAWHLRQRSRTRAHRPGAQTAGADAGRTHCRHAGLTDRIRSIRVLALDTVSSVLEYTTLSAACQSRAKSSV